MSEKIELLAEARTDLGKGASRRLRHTGKTPAIVYGVGEPISVTLEHKDLWKAQEAEAFYSTILNLKIDGSDTDVVVKDMQRHPFKPLVMHVDFLRVDAKQEIHTNIPVHFVNEEALNKAGAVITHHVNEIEVSCLPKHLPEFIEVDLADVEVGQTLHLTDVALPKGVTSVEVAKGESHDIAIVSANAPKASASEDTESADDAAGEEEATEE